MFLKVISSSFHSKSLKMLTFKFFFKTSVLNVVVCLYPVEREIEMPDGVYGIGKGAGTEVGVESRKT